MKLSVVPFWQGWMKVVQQTWLIAMFTLMLAIAGIPAAWAAEPTMVQDINMVPPSWRSKVQALVAHQGKVFFVANDADYDRGEIHGMGLWQTDGTLAGTVLTKTFNAPPCTGNVEIYVGGGGACEMFSANGLLWIGGVWGLWISDGTADGTRELVQFDSWQIDLTQCNYEQSLQFTAAAGKVFFIGLSNANGYEVWSSDGTPAGTGVVADLATGDVPYEEDVGGSWETVCNHDIGAIAEVSGKVFIATQGGVWLTDGTPDGTVKVLNDTQTQWDGRPRTGLAASTGAGTFVFLAFSRGELWKSDGTVGGTMRVALPSSIRPAYSAQLTRAGNAVYFIAYDNSGVVGRHVLVKVESSTGHVSVLSDSPLEPEDLAEFNGALVAWGRSSSYPYGLWKSDGTTAGTTFVAPTSNGTLLGEERTRTAISDGELYFLVDVREPPGGAVELWKSDGTLAGTSAVKRIYEEISYNDAGALAATASGKLLVALQEELWTSNGTQLGTFTVNTSGQTSSSAFRRIWNAPWREANGKFFLIADDGIHGEELWLHDPVAGPRMVRDIAPGISSSIGFNDEWTSVDGTLYFVASDGVHGPELWKSDGTAAGTLMLRDIAPGIANPNIKLFTAVNGVLLFAADDGVSGREVWRTDGTALGTLMVKDIWPGGASSIDTTGMVAARKSAQLGAAVYFAANDGTHGPELWRSDGTANGTVLVRDIRAGSLGSGPTYFTTVNGNLFFTAYQKDSGVELWRTNGTGSGTILLKDILPGAQGSQPYQLTAHNGVLYFTLNFDWSVKAHLWRTDGSAAGTYLVKDMSPGLDSFARGASLASMGGALFFSHTIDAAGTSHVVTWKSDGTPNGTKVWREFAPGQLPSMWGATMLDGIMYFPMHDRTYGSRLWRTDGTDAGTIPLEIARPGYNGINPRFLFARGDALFFVGHDHRGYEMWTYTPDRTTPDANPVLQLNFNEGSGTTTIDESSTARVARLTNAAWRVGVEGNSIRVNGNGYARVLDDAALDVSDGVTMGAWIKPSTSGQTSYVMAKNLDATTQFAYGLGLRQGVLAATLENKTFKSTFVPPVNVWTHIAATWNGTTLTLYANGQPVRQAAHAVTLSANSQRLLVGARNANGAIANGFVGNLDVVQLWDGARTGQAVCEDARGVWVSGACSVAVP